MVSIVVANPMYPNTPKLHKTAASTIRIPPVASTIFDSS